VGGEEDGMDRADEDVEIARGGWEKDRADAVDVSAGRGEGTVKDIASGADSVSHGDF
jgi:hypothetical protein